MSQIYRALLVMYTGLISHVLKSLLIFFLFLHLLRYARGPRHMSQIFRALLVIHRFYFSRLFISFDIWSLLTFVAVLKRASAHVSNVYRSKETYIRERDI